MSSERSSGIVLEKGPAFWVLGFESDTFVTSF